MERTASARTGNGISGLFTKPLKRFDFTLAVHPCGRVCLSRKTRREVKTGRVADNFDTGLVSVRNSHNSTRVRNFTRVSHQPDQSGARAKPLTALAKSRIVGACHFLETKYGRQGLTFWTGTIPSTDPELLKRLDQDSSRLIKLFRLYIGRALKKVGCDPDHIVCVIEYQKRGAIHLHAVFPRLPIRVTDRIWAQLVTLIARPELPLDFKCACKSERIRKSVARYLAKYLSKPSQKKNRGAVWSIGRPLTAFLKNAVLKLDVSLDLFKAESLKNVLRSCSFFTLGATWLSLSGYLCSVFDVLQWLLNFVTPELTPEFLYLWVDISPP